MMPHAPGGPACYRLNHMKKLIALSMLFSAAAFAETYSGTLMDTMCKGESDIAAHTKKCALGCAKHGYGLMTSDGKFLKFDEAGNAQAMAALKASTKEKDLKATVTGDSDGDTLKVKSVSLD
jgi:hypothetical protein